MAVVCERREAPAPFSIAWLETNRLGTVVRSFTLPVDRLVY